MLEIDICGKRGLGDITSTISDIIINYKIEGHYRFHYPPGFGYVQAISDLMEEFIPPSGLKITYEIDETFFSVRNSVCDSKFGIQNLNKTYFFSACKNRAKHAPMRTLWEGNKQGPIGLIINNERWGPDYPYPKKFFDEKVNFLLSSFIDNKNYVTLGLPKTVAESIKIMSKCRYLVGIDTGWAHVSKCVGVPYFVTRNKLDVSFLQKLHSKADNIKIIESRNIFDYLVI